MSSPAFCACGTQNLRPEVGYLCSIVNEAYCEKHGYGFRRVLVQPDEMASLSGGRHGAWAKAGFCKQAVSEEEGRKGGHG